MFTVDQIRQRFVEFFAQRGHVIVPSSSLIPHDPSLLLANAGMNQFKPYMVGEELPPYPRAASVQKVFRTVDIDIIGTTRRHLTFFEMLGNFSLGDYFKEKAIPWAWELVTEVFGIEADRLWVTVYETDDEAAEIWHEAVGLPAERIVRMGKDNFWDMGTAGPCGPSSEIYYDKGPEFGTEGGPAVDDERYIEFWNLVFMQYLQDSKFQIVGDLPQKNIDTGGGLERFAVVLNGLDSVFEVDSVLRVVEAAAKATGVVYGREPARDVSLRVLADHARAITFLLSDGVFPSNMGRGYVLRRIVRRAVRHAHLLGREEPILPVLVEAVVGIMASAYPEIEKSRDLVLEVASREEHRFRQTLRQGLTLLDAELGRLEGKVLPGDVAFKLHDTYGFPIDLTREVAGEVGVEIDMEGFGQEMEAQRRRGKEDRETAGAGAGPLEADRDVFEEFGPTEFVGYRTTEAEARVLALVSVEGDRLDMLEAGQEASLFADVSPFFAEGGGQVGDTGTIHGADAVVDVLDTQAAVSGLFRHRVRGRQGRLMAGETARMSVDGPRREAIRKNHTATHLLHWALRSVLGEHVKQHGSLVASDRLRFDFSHYNAVTSDELAETERRANARVLLNEEVRAFETTKSRAEELGALAFFGDKYGEVVRVVEAGQMSRELCGGTHVDALGMIGPIVILSEGSIGANVRRIEALSGDAALDHLRRRSDTLVRTGGLLRVPPDEVPDRVARLLEEQSAAQKEASRQRREATASRAQSRVDQAKAAGERVVTHREDGTDPDTLKFMAESIRDGLGSGIALVAGSPDGTRVSVVAAVSKDLQGRVQAGELAALMAKVVGGGGGKGPAVALAGGRDPGAIGDALAAAEAAAHERLGS